MKYGLTVPFDGIPLREHPAIFEAAVAAGFDDLWSSEVNGADAFTPLAIAATLYPHLRLGTAIVPAYTRSPALLAMSAASLADATDAEVLLGIGSSSNVIVERWNGIPFRDPYSRVRDVLQFLRQALTGDKVDFESDSFRIQGFRLGRVPERRPKVLLAALRPGMLRLAGSTSDGVILNWLSPADVRRVVPIVEEAHPAGEPEVVARLFVIPSDDLEQVRSIAKRMITAYLNVPVYAAFHAWLGRSELLEDMWSAWAAGDRVAALDAVPDQLVDELFVHGTPNDCRAQIDEYVAAGVRSPMLAITPTDEDVLGTIRTLGRSR